MNKMETSKMLITVAVLAVVSHQTIAGVSGGLELVGSGGYGGSHVTSIDHQTGPLIENGGYGHGDHASVDYVAYPKYDFAYGVTDDHTGDSKAQKESRDGHHVVGEYELKEPGGNVRTVKYEADNKGGFFAHVINHGGNDHGHGHSIANFQGPVSGPSYPFPVHGGHGGY